MATFFILLLFVSLAGLTVGLIRPTLFARIKLPTRKLVGLVFGGLFLISLIGVGITAEPLPKEPKSGTEQPIATEAVVTTTPTTTSQTQQPQQATQQQTNTVLVTRVIDGDTIEIEGGQKVRYIGIDTPETVDPRKPVQCFGVEASNKNKELVSGKRVRLEKDVSETDKYGRLLRYIYIGDTFVNLELVKQGFAYSSTYPPDVKHQSQFTEAQRQAKEQNKGLWSSCPVATPTPTVTATPSTTQQPSSCDIKGNISSSDEKIYHVPGCASYNATKIDEARGEKWFCSETEALAAGWRKALNCP
ncbi:MAG TPA: thermonuclease family protein [Candidatus Paceibacterota bacterium]|nr:thermonuclease family protein [Candidatus Paceibacterota bacterium]